MYAAEVALKKGEYKILLALRHDDPTVLSRFKAAPLVIERALEPSVHVPVYHSAADAALGAHEAKKERVLRPGERLALFLGAPDEAKLPKDATPGRLLVGALALGRTAEGEKAPGGAALLFAPPPKRAEPLAVAAGAEEAADAAAAGEERGAPARLAEALRDAEVKFFSEMKGDSEEARAERAAVLASLKARFPAHLPLLRAALKAAAPAGEKDEAAAAPARGAAEAALAAADELLAAVDATALAVHLARAAPEEGPGAARRKREFDEQRGAVVEARAARAAALLDLGELEAAEKAAAGAGAGAGAASGAPAAAASPSTPAEGDAVEAAFAELRRWVDPAADAAHAALAARREARAGRPALALRALERADGEGAPARAALDRRAALFKELGWEHWARAERDRARRAFPPGPPPLP